MRILFMGTPDLSATVLTALLGSKHEIIGVITQPDAKKGRGQQIVFSPVKELALKHEIEIMQPERLKEEWVFNRISELSPEAIVVAAFGQIIPKSILELPKYGCINVHTSLLPKYRGASPIQWAVINGEKYSGVTIMHMDAGIDTGDIIMQRSIELDKEETGGSLYDKLALLGGQLLLSALDRLLDGTAERIKQNSDEATYVKVLDKTMGKIDFNKSACVIERLIRGLNPWPSAFTYIDGKMLKIWRAEAVSCEELSRSTEEYEAGTVARTDKNSLYIKTGEGFLKVLELQLEGKKKMSIGDFLRGYTVAIGKKLE